MNALARRAPLRFLRPIANVYKITRLPPKRAITASSFSRQAVEETAESEQIETLDDAPVFLDDDTTQVDWSRSFHGLSAQPFSEEAAKVLTAPIDIGDVEIKPGTVLNGRG